VFELIAAYVRAWRCGDIPYYVRPNWHWV